MENYDVAVVGLGALGSAAAYHLALRGVSVIALEQYELGHVRGASHDTSRIVRTSYAAPAYVRLAQSAYRDWAELERVSGERLLTQTGGVVFCPPDLPGRAREYAAALDGAGVPYELLDAAEVRSRWPQFHISDDVETVYTPDSGIAHAARTVATLQMQARMHGAVIRDRTPVLRLSPQGSGVIVHTESGDIHAGKVILATDAWTNTLLEPLGETIPLVTMQEQVSYFRPDRAEDFDDLPVWIWDAPVHFYGFPTYGEPSIKAARDMSENHMTPEERTYVPSPELLDELTRFMAGLMPASGQVLRTVTCQYALTLDRNFVISPLTTQPDIIVGLSAGHGFKFTPAIGRILAELAIDGETSDDVSLFTAAFAQGGEATQSHRAI